MPSPKNHCYKLASLYKYDKRHSIHLWAGRLIASSNLIIPLVVAVPLTKLKGQLYGNIPLPASQSPTTLDNNILHIGTTTLNYVATVITVIITNVQQDSVHPHTVKVHMTTSVLVSLCTILSMAMS